MTFRKILSLDIETRSDVDLVKRGVYNYVNAPFSILWLTYAYDYGERVTLDLWDGAIPDQLANDIKDPTVLKVAANATFERICFSRMFGVYLAPESWTCTLVLAGRNGLPMHLDGAAAQARVNVQKHASGKELIKMFSIPQKPTKKNNGVMWINPQDAPEQWQAYGHYNNIDVAAETDVRLAIKNNMPVSEFEETLYHIDQRINDRGVLIDLQFVEQAIRMNQIFTERVKAEVIQITGVQNPNSRNQLLEWLNGATPGNFENFTKLDKDTVQGIINGAPEPIIQKVLEARQYISKASVAKYAAMKNYACEDGRARGFLKFYKANRTGRWAGTGIQPHNLTKHKCSPEQLDVMRALIKAGDVEGLAAANKGDLTGALSQCVRTSFIAKPGHHFLVSDYSAIEARVLAWLAGETWRLEFFKGEGDIYIESAARMFKVPAASIGKKDPLRQNGKVAELACIAEGQLVLTDKGLVPIEKVSKLHKVWDGLRWATQEGVIFKGIKHVIIYDGLKATKDHLVWVEGERTPVRFGYAAAFGLTLRKSGTGGENLRTRENSHNRATVQREMGKRTRLCSMPVVRKTVLDKLAKPKHRKEQRMPSVLTTETNTAMVGQAFNRSKATMREPERRSLSVVRRSRREVPLRFGNTSWVVYIEKRTQCEQGSRIRSHKERGSLRTWEPSIHSSETESGKQTLNTNTFLEPGRVALRVHSRRPVSRARIDQGSDYRKSQGSRSSKEKELARDCGEVRVYDLVNCGPQNRFTVSGVLVHNCGYQGGVGALIQMDRDGAIDQKLMPSIIKLWREENPAIVAFWKNLENAALKALVTHDQYIPVGREPKIWFYFNSKSGNLHMVLPSGRWLTYVRAKIVPGKFGNSAVQYEGVENGKWSKLDTYGGKFAENCLTCDTLILTRKKRWIPVVEVSKTDELWDGIQWVKHAGLIHKGYQNTIRVDGVGITYDHLILTENGWKEASQVEGYYRYENKQFNRSRIRGFKRIEIFMARSLRLRRGESHASHGVFKGKNKILRVQKRLRDFRNTNDPRQNSAADILGVEIHESQMSKPKMSRISQLRRSRYPSMPAMAHFREFLVRHGVYIRKGAVAREKRCERALRALKLQMGDAKRSRPKQKNQSHNEFSLGSCNRSRGFGTLWDRSNDATLPTNKRLSRQPFVLQTGCYESVYDIKNSGPRNRFMVKSENGEPFIVHNCTQAVARDILGHGIYNLDRAGFEIVLHVHDETVSEEPINGRSLEEVNHLMCLKAHWYEDLPLKAEGFVSPYYKKDDK